MTAARRSPVHSASSSQERISKPKLLLVEGREDLIVFRELCEYWGFEDIQIIKMEGITNLRARLKVLVRDSGFQDLRTLGIARDADDDARRAFQSVRDALADIPSFGTALPTRAGVRSGSSPTTAVFIAPDNEDPGNLETMLNRTRAGDMIDGCIDEYFECLSKRAGFDRLGSRRDKARAHARIATSSNPARSVGHSVRASGLWDLDHESLEPVKAFLSSL